MKILSKILILVISSFLIVSCSTMTVTKGRMLKTPVNYNFSKFDSLEKSKDYRIAVDDEINFTMLANDGYSYLTLGAYGNTNGNNNSQTAGISYKVRPDSTIKVPIIGKVKVVGLTLNEIETLFEQILAKQFQSPFVLAKIENKRIFVFSGISSATVLTLTNQNTTLFEVIAKLGGIQGGGKADRIKIIRGDFKNPKVYLVNLSKIEGIKDANLIMQAGDIVYIEPIINYGAIITSDFTSLMSILTTGVLVYTLIK